LYSKPQKIATRMLLLASDDLDEKGAGYFKKPLFI